MKQDNATGAGAHTDGQHTAGGAAATTGAHTTGAGGQTEGPTAGPTAGAPVRRKRGRPRRPTFLGPRYVQVTAVIEPESLAALDREAQNRRLPSRSELIREFVNDGLRRLEKRRERQAEKEGMHL